MRPLKAAQSDLGPARAPEPAPTRFAQAGPDPVNSADQLHHVVVVVGGGFAGLAAVRGGAGVRITLIDHCNHHLFQPLLYQVATTILAASDVAWPLRGLMRGRKDVTTVLARVASVDAPCSFDDGGELGYDTLDLATGARHHYFGHDDWEQHAPGLKTLGDAIRIRERVLMALERAERSHDAAERAALQTFVLIGGGATGVEPAGIIAELTQTTVANEFRAIDTRQCRIVLIEAGPRLLAAFPERLSQRAEAALARRGVECGWVKK